MPSITPESIAARIAQGPFAASWDSLEAYTVPDWYIDGKFGIFIHWGPYSVPAFGNEWYARSMYVQGTKEYEHHLATYGPHTQFGYKDFIAMLTAERFDAAGWSRLFKQAGARFVVPAAEHHDGFQMYASELSRWNAGEMGPRRDILGQLADAVRADGMVLGVSSHRAEHWWYMNGGNAFDSDVQDPAYADFYGPAKGMDRPVDNHITNPPDQAFLEDWMLRNCELIDKYRPQLFWFDWWIMNMAFKPWLKKFAAYYYNSAAQWGQGVAINHKVDAFPTGTTVLDIERGQVERMHGLFWQNDTSVSKNSWGHIKDHDYKDVGDIICDLIDVVSKNGALLLSIGPCADGTIPEPEQQMLQDIGKWLQVSGEGIYETRPWRESGEGPTKVLDGSFTDTKREAFTSADIRFTSRQNVVYAHVMKWPADGTVRISLLGRASMHRLAGIDSIELLGEECAVTWQVDDDALKVDLHGCKPTDRPLTLKICGHEA